jgi:hypothetical protein
MSDQAHKLLRFSVHQAQSYRDWLATQGAARKMINRRLSSLSSFYKCLGGAGADVMMAGAARLCSPPGRPDRSCRCSRSSTAKRARLRLRPLPGLR